MEKDRAGDATSPEKPKLGLWDAVSIIVGIVIGASIFQTPPTIFQNVATPLGSLGVWFLCGVLSLVGALCYAELATTYPRSGGDYVYLTRAFGPWCGFLFGWAQLTVILSGSTGAMAFIFGEYAADLFDVAEANRSLFAAGAGAAAVLVLAAMNAAGVVLGKWIQNGLVILKLIGLSAIVVVGLMWSKSGTASEAGWTTPREVGAGGFGLAMILVLYAYGGWNDAAFVAADVRERRNIARSLILGTLAVVVIYLAVNLAYIHGLGFDDARNFRRTIATDVISLALPREGAKVMSVLVMISALGAINGLIFTGSRVYSALGAEHSVFALLGRWYKTFSGRTPLWSLFIQAGITLVMIVLVGTDMGRGAVDGLVTMTGAAPVPWKDYYGGFNTLFAGTAPVFWTFFLLTGMSFFVLRFKEPHVKRPFSLPLPAYPLLPLVFCGMCAFGLYSAVVYAGWVSLIGVIPLALGIPLFFASRRTAIVEKPQVEG